LRRHPGVTVAAGLIVTLVSAVVAASAVPSMAWAYTTSSGSGTGHAPVATLAAPTSVTGTATGSDVQITWTGTPSPTGATGAVDYFVTRSPVGGGTPVVVCGSPTLVATTSCSDVAVPDGAFTYVVTAVFATWTADSTASAPIATGPVPTSTSFALSTGPVTYGDETSIVATATVAGQGPGGPTGTIAISTGGVTLCSVILPATSCSPDATALDASETAYPVTATYDGDGTFTSSTSSSQDLEVGQDTTTATVSTSQPSVTVGAEGAATLSVMVTTGQGEPLPATEPVTITVGPTSCQTTLSPDTGGGQGWCWLGASDLPADTNPYVVTTTYAGDADLAASGPVSALGGLTVIDAPVITTTSLTPAVAGEVGYSQTLTATGGASPLVWFVTGGSLPKGLALDQSTGVLSGDLSAGDVTAQLTITAEDANQGSASGSFTLVVTNPHMGDIPVSPGTVPAFQITLPIAVATGDTLVLSVAQSCTKGSTPVDAHVTGVTGGSVTWARAVSTGCGPDGDVEVWYGLNAPAAAPGAAVSVTLNADANVSYADLAEYSGITGLDTSVGSTHSGQGITGAVSPGASTPGTAGELVVSDAYVGTATPASLVGLVDPFVSLGTVSPFRGLATYAVDGTTTPLSYTYTQAAGGVPTSGPWSAAIAAFTLGS